MDKVTQSKLLEWARKYNDKKYFTADPIRFPTLFADRMKRGEAVLQDVEIAGLFAAHLAWGRRSTIVNDLDKLFGHMEWQPFEFVRSGCCRRDGESVHRTIKWSEIAAISDRLRDIYSSRDSIEGMSVEQIRTDIFGSRADRNAANKKINLFRRWMVRRDGIVDLGLWKNSSPAELLIPLDVHVMQSASELGLTKRHSADARTVAEITDAMRQVFPDDPCLGDYALFGHGLEKDA